MSRTQRASWRTPSDVEQKPDPRHTAEPAPGGTGSPDQTDGTGSPDQTGNTDWSVSRRLLPSFFAAVAALLWAGPYLHLQPWIGFHLTDIPTYQRSADATAAGRLPYRDVDLEYPPGAAVIFWLARFLPGQGYVEKFQWFMLLFWALATAGAVVAAGQLRLPVRRQVAVGTLMAITPLVLGTIVRTRYDGVVTAVVAWMIVAALAERWRWMWGLLAVAIALKLMPALLAPALVAWQAHRAGWASARRGAAGGIAATVALFAPAALLAPRGLWDMVMYHLQRPPQIESTASSYVLLWHATAGVPVTIESAFGSQGPTGQTAEVLATATTLLAFLAIVAVSVRYARHLGALVRGLDAAYLLATLAATIVFLAVGSKVLSPQYLLWIVPASLLLPGRRGLTAFVMTPVLMLVTHLYFPFRYWNLVGLETLPIWILFVRNLLLIALACVCWSVSPAAPTPRAPALAD